MSRSPTSFTGTGGVVDPVEPRRSFERLRAGGDARLRDRLIVEHRELAEQCARRFRNRGESESDLTQVAYLALIKAVDRYDPTREVPFHGYAVPTIIGELKRHFRDATWSVSVPRRSKDLLSRLTASNDRLYQELGRPPSVHELSTDLHVDDAAVESAVRARTANRTGPIPEVGRCLDGGDDLTEMVEARVELASAMAAFDDRTRTILWWRYWEECSQREIGERLGIGQVQVSRILRSALSAMRASSPTAA